MANQFKSRRDSSSKDARFWDRAAAKYAASTISDQDGYQRSLRRVSELLERNARVLEIGCGTGTSAINLASSADHIVATDLSGEMIAIAKAKATQQGINNVSFKRATVEEIDDREGPFDVVLALNVLHLLRDLPASLDRMRGILRPHGILICKTPCLGQMNPLIRWVALPTLHAIGKAPHVVSMTERDLVSAIQFAAFQVESVEHHSTNARNSWRPFIVARA